MIVAKLSKEQALQILETVNPMGLIDINGRLIIYKSPSDCYIGLIRLLWATCPRGWIDIPFMMAKYQGLRISRAKEHCGRKSLAVVEWCCDPSTKAAQRRNEKLKSIFRCFLNATGIAFSENAFQMAVYDFDRSLNTWKTPDRGAGVNLHHSINNH